MDDRPRLGIIGGSFNPPHIGHLAIASDVHAMLGLERVLFVPAAAPVHKDVDFDVPAAARVEMTRLAVAGDERFAVSTIEIERGLRYTLDTVVEIRQEFPGNRLVFIMGSDSLMQFESWHQPSAILALCRIAVAPRPGDDLRAVEEEARALGPWPGLRAADGDSRHLVDDGQRPPADRPARPLPRAVGGRGLRAREPVVRPLVIGADEARRRLVRAPSQPRARSPLPGGRRDGARSGGALGRRS